MKRLRLLKVVIQPTFVIDDGESLQEMTSEPITITPTDWPDYAKTTFVEQVNLNQNRLNETKLNAVP